MSDEPWTPESRGISPRVQRPSTERDGFDWWDIPSIWRSLPRNILQGQRIASRFLGSQGPVPRQAIDDIARAKYPQLAAFLDHPEVGPVLRRAALEGWGPEELYGALQPTSWWQQTSSAARQWDLLMQEDPAEAARLAAQTAANITNRSRSLGLRLSQGSIEQLALTATRNNWTDNQVVDALLGSFNWDEVSGGQLAALRDSVKRIGAEYLVNVSDHTAQSYATAIASGEMTEAGVASVMQRQARNRFTWMAEDIDNGVTPVQYFMPLRDAIAAELEMTPDAISLSDPKWLGMIERTDADGRTRAATINEARMAARQRPEYARTSRAQELTTSAVQGIREAFGRRPI